MNDMNIIIRAIYIKRLKGSWWSGDLYWKYIAPMSNIEYDRYLHITQNLGEDS